MSSGRRGAVKPPHSKPLRPLSAKTWLHFPDRRCHPLSGRPIFSSNFRGMRSKAGVFTGAGAIGYEAPLTNASADLGVETITSPAIAARAWKFFSLKITVGVTS